MSFGGQAWFFAMTVMTGAAIGLFYDAFRILRKTAPFFAKTALAVQDTIFWFGATGAVFYMILHENFGEIRMFAILGAALGVVIYFAALSRLVIFVSVNVIEFLKKVITAAMKIIFAPIIAFYKWASPKVRLGLSRLSRYGKMKGKKVWRNWFILRKKV